MMSDRAILLTPAGSAAIAVVRLIGPGVEAFLLDHFSGRPAEGRCVHGNIVDGDRVIDDAVVAICPAECLADINLHGGPWVVRSMLELAGRCGFEVVEGIPLDAFDAPTLLEREVMAHLPFARTELALRTLLAQPRAWASLLGGDDGHLPDRLSCILNDLSLYWMLNPPRVAIIGAPNVGKSTLANQLFAQERSITADLPGTTRDWVGEIANIDGLAVMLIDTPGQREATDPIERLAIEQSGRQITAADLVLLVLDPTQPLEPAQSVLLGRHSEAVRILNKSDRPAVWDAGGIDAIPTVATEGQGIDALRAAIRRHFGCEAVVPAHPRWWTMRQRDVLVEASGNPDAAGAILGRPIGSI